MDYRRLLYTSRARGTDRSSDQIAILGQSRSNNGLNGVTGLLWTDNRRYLQVLEGPPDAVSLTFERIKGDERHDELRVLADTVETSRAFFDWFMASLFPGESNAELQTRLARVLRNSPGDVRAEFAEAISGSVHA